MSASLVRLVLGDGRATLGSPPAPDHVHELVRRAARRGPTGLAELLEQHLSTDGATAAGIAVLAHRRLGEGIDDLVAAADLRGRGTGDEEAGDAAGHRLLEATRPLWRDERLERLARRPRLPHAVALGSLVASCRLSVDDAAEISLHGSCSTVADCAVDRAGFDREEVQQVVLGLHSALGSLVRRAARTRCLQDLPEAPTVLIDLPRRPRAEVPQRSAS